MDVHWSVLGQQLVLINSNDELFRPTFSDLVSSNNADFSWCPDNMPVHHPFNSDLPDLKFSRIGVKTIFNIDFDNDKIRLNIFFDRKHKSYPLIVPVSKLNDIIILDNSIIKLDVLSINDILKQSGICDVGELSLTQYTFLTKIIDDFPSLELIDNAKSKLSSHPVVKADIVQLKAKLYPYQEVGVGWLQFIANQKAGCILGDEMGLGKTLQVIALIAARRDIKSHPCLVVAPASLMENWKREFEKFTEGIHTYIHHGKNRTGFYKKLLDFDVIITSYSTLVGDLSLFLMIDWDILVLDEAQYIKNPNSSRTRAIKKLKRDVSIAVTGTPFENHLTDIWSLMDFIVPGSMGTLSSFNSKYSDDTYDASLIEPMITPLLLRRNVAEVANDLPEKIEIPIVLEMDDEEAVEYERIRQSIIEQCAGNYSTLLLQKLRMFCTDPSLVDVDSHNVISKKHELLLELLEEISAIGEKVIIFTSFNGMFDILMNEIDTKFNIPVFKINGSVKISERQNIIDEYSDIVGPAVIILNPSAAGVGLNITAASRVIHYNLEWNPSKEDQASARAYRRGQEKTVFIYRLYYKNTVEEVINERVERKRDIFDVVVKGVDGNEENMADIVHALNVSPVGD